MLKRIGVVFPTLFVLSLVSSTIADADNHVTLSKLLTAIEKLVGYYAENYHVMNLDGIFGLRVLEGQILNLLKKYATEPNLATFPLWANKRLQEIYAKVKDAADSSIKFLKKKSPEYYQNLKYLVEYPMTVAVAYRRIDPTLIWDATEKKNITTGEFTEEFSDNCMALIMGTTSPPQPKCTFSDECIKMMFTKGQADYTITHQLLFTTLAEKEGCLAKLNAKILDAGFPGGVAHLRLEFCTNNLFEVAATVKEFGGIVVPRYQDLFMEQEFVCSQLGFMEFLHSDWLDEIIKWQRPNGCYGAMKRKTSFHGVPTGDDAEYVYADDIPKYDKKEQNEVFKFDQNIPKRDRNPPAGVGKVNNAAVIATKDVRRRFPGNAPIVNDGNVNGARDGEEIRPKPQRNQVGNVQDPGQALSVNENGPLGQQGVQNKVDSSQQKLRFQDHNDGRHGQEEIQPVRNQAQIRSVEGIRPVERGGLRDNVEKEPGRQWFQERYGGKIHQRQLHDGPALPQKLTNFRTMRRLLVEEDLPDGCLAHKTAVAAGALSQYLRYVLSPGSLDYQRHTRLTGNNYIANPHLLRSRSSQHGLAGVVVMEQGVPKRDDNHPDDAMKAKENAEIVPKKDDEAGKRVTAEPGGALNRPEIDDHVAPRDGDDDEVRSNQGPVGKHGAIGDDKGSLGINVRAPEDAPGMKEHDKEAEAAGLQKHTIDVDDGDDDAYGNRKHADVDKDTDDRHSNEIVVGHADEIANADVPGMVPGSNVSATSVLKAYVLIIAVMFFLIVFMCKFLRKHRVHIRYRHR